MGQVNGTCNVYYRYQPHRVALSFQEGDVIMAHPIVMVHRWFSTKHNNITLSKTPCLLSSLSSMPNSGLGSREVPSYLPDEWTVAISLHYYHYFGQI